AAFQKGDVVNFPIAHHDGNYFAGEDVLKELEDNQQIAFRYVENPNGSANDIAGIYNKGGNILGMMPHPERVISDLLGGVDGKRFFEGLMK
ncbi:MAG: phosphoribosylformylglycinamidine synthase I, partial [Alphaproteobacteria bacterium CG11_big_fil_rev_8_21_14_0_20_44_7]